MVNNQKKELGAFYTTNVKKILNNITFIPDGFSGNFIDPFAGNKDLLYFVRDNFGISEDRIFSLDINPNTNPNIVINSIISPLDEYLSGNFVITNPPYLLKNKTLDRVNFPDYLFDDLYKNSFYNVINSGSKNGLFIIPSNFLFDEDRRFREFLYNSIKIDNIYIYNFSTFDDTDIRVAVVVYSEGITESLNITIFSDYNVVEKVFLNEVIDKDYKKIGVSFFDRIRNSKSLAIRKPGDSTLSTLFLRTTDSRKDSLGFFYDENLSKTYNPKISDRNIVQIMVDPGIDAVLSANNFIQNERLKYNDLFLSNFLPSKNFNRKRIPINLATRILSSFLFD